MNKIEAIIQPFRLDAVKEALIEVGAQGMTVSHVEGFGEQKGQQAMFRGAKFTAQFVAKIKIEVVVAQSMTERAVAAIVKAARTGNIGDGKIFVHPLQQVIRIRTGEENHEALSSLELADAK